MITTLLLSTLFILLTAPEGVRERILIPEPPVVCEYDVLIDAITWIESTHGLNTFNPRENAVGWFQIRQIRVDDYNKRTGNNYKLDEFYDYNFSREMFIFYARMYNDWETIAKRWNGSGPMTITYWDKVKNRINETLTIP